MSDSKPPTFKLDDDKVAPGRLCALSWFDGIRGEYELLVNVGEDGARELVAKLTAWLDAPRTEIARLTAAPADDAIAAATAALVEAATAEGKAMALHALPTGDDETYGAYSRAVDDRAQAEHELREAIAAALRSTATPATVGGLLATATEGSIVEWLDAHARWRQCQIGSECGDPVWRDRAWVNSRWRSWCAWMGVDVDAFLEPARLVPADQADADPATRGPIGGGS